MIPRKNNRILIVTVLIILALVPMLITAYELIFTADKSVVFLGNFHPKVAVLILFYYAVLLGVGVFWLIRQIILVTKLKSEKAKAELMLLKSQVNPHFFFNMLNNLYGLVAKDPKKAQELILKLSEMMRYTIYEGEKETVKLQEEITFLKHYVELHKMRYHKPITIDFTCNADENLKVVPLLFIILLENAFKHGIEKLRENAYIKIVLTSSENNINFTVTNNYEKTENKLGIGLKNLKRRLNLIYPSQHQLNFSVTENYYQVQLILKQV